MFNKDDLEVLDTALNVMMNSERRFYICCHCVFSEKCFKNDGITLKKNNHCETIKRQLTKLLK